MAIPVPPDGNLMPAFSEAVQRRLKRGSIERIVPPATALRPGDALGRDCANGGPTLLRPTMSGLSASLGSSISLGRDVLDLEPSSSDYPFTYRSVTLYIDRDWLSSYIDDYAHLYRAEEVGFEEGYGQVSSIADALDMLWPEFRAEAKGKHSVFHSLLGCYNLPREPMEEALFWKNGWGSPSKVYYYAMQLIRTYIDYIEVEIHPCTGFGTFIETLFKGEAAENDVGETCTLTMSYRNAERDHDYVHEPCDRDLRGVTCEDGFNTADPGCDGAPYDTFLDDKGWDTTENCWNGQVSGTGQCALPDSMCGSDGRAAIADSNFMVIMQVVHLAWRGWLCDFLLWWARIGLDYALYLYSLPDTGSTRIKASTTLKRAQQLARYALRTIAAHASTIIHEMGHVKAGSGHCDHNCCMNVAREPWLCKVRAHLGLPQQELTLRSPDDYNNTSYIEDLAASCTDGDYEWMCDTGREGVAGSEGLYCVSNCHTYADKGPDDERPVLDGVRYCDGLFP